MADRHIYLDSSGNDSNGGTSWSDAVRYPVRAQTLADNYNTGSGGTDVVTVHVRGHIGIASGGTASDILFNSGTVWGGNLAIAFEDDSWIAYGTFYGIGESGYQAVTLVIPSGCTIEQVSYDHAMKDTTHYLSDGRAKRFLNLAANAAACQATSGTYFHSGSTLHFNSPTALGYVCVRYRPSAAVLMFQIIGQGITFTGNGSTTGIIYPIYVSNSIGCYGIQFVPSTLYYTGYTVTGIVFMGSWHAIGLIDPSPSGTLAISNVSTTNCRFISEVVSDATAGTVCYNPIVIYSGNTSGVPGTPVTLVITNWYTSGCTFDHFRPVYHDGTSVAAGSGGTTCNNISQQLYSHGGNADFRISITCPATGGVSFRGNTVNIWDYQITDPWFCQRNTQSYSDAVHTDSAWNSFSEDNIIRSRLAYSASYDALSYGMCTFSEDCNIRMRRMDWAMPDRNVADGALGGLMGFTIGSSGAATYCEIEESRFTVAGNRLANYGRVIRAGSSGAGTVKLRIKNTDFIIETGSMSSDIVWFDGLGASMLATVEIRRCLFHSTDSTHQVIMYDFDTTQLPLYSTSSTRLICQDNWYSQVRAGGYDANATQRDTEAEWKANSGDGPHDGTLGNGAGRDAQYGSAGTWNSTTRSFAASDPIRTTTISNTVTILYPATFGLNRQLFNRNYGSYFTTAISRTSSATKVLLEV